MRDSRGLILTCLVCLITLTILSCANRKLTSTKAKTPATKRTLVLALERYEPVYQWYSGKARLKVSTEDLRVGATMHLRMIRDSLIWAKLDKLGFELGRALITPDSAYVMDRVNKVYYVDHLDSFLLSYNAPFTFTDLQQVLAGGMLKVPAREVSMVSEGGRYGLSMRTNAYFAQYWFDQLFRPEEGTFTDTAQRKVRLWYTDYREPGTGPAVPYARSVAFDDGYQTAEITIEFAEIEVDVPKTVPFTIPGHYVKVD
ncbi:MAG: DUF4292 domain-containing protein [Saprospiraceae bacterium]|nr:DUF4292 domain-containing protein [Saprospiraceae bacterium]